MANQVEHQMVRRLPAVDRVVKTAELQALEERVPRALIVDAARRTLQEMRTAILEGWMPEAKELSPETIANRVSDRASRAAVPSLRRAINATGVVLHTGLGRAVLPEAARQALASVAGGHSNLEIDLETGTRGSRQEHLSRLLTELTGAEAALAVNNNSAAVLLALNTVARGGEVIVSRGHLVEIGGSFRLPDIMARSGARLVEVGTTNRTRLSDYEDAITDDTRLILRVHPSNFRIVGFTEEVPIGDLVEMAHRYYIPVLDDVGSGALVDMKQFGLTDEPLIQESIKAGADIVTSSADKLLGGPQAGLILGQAELVSDIARNPLARVMRIDKLAAAALESTLRLYSDPDTLMETVPTLRYIARSVGEISRLAVRVRRGIRRAVGDAADVLVVDGRSEIGGGSLPGQDLPSKLVAISSHAMSPLEMARAFRLADPPVVGRVGEDRFLLDLRTVESAEIPEIVRVASEILTDRPPVAATLDR